MFRSQKSSTSSPTVDQTKSITKRPSISTNIWLFLNQKEIFSFFFSNEVTIRIQKKKEKKNRIIFYICVNASSETQAKEKSKQTIVQIIDKKNIETIRRMPLTGGA